MVRGQFGSFRTSTTTTTTTSTTSSTTTGTTTTTTTTTTSSPTSLPSTPMVLSWIPNSTSMPATAAASTTSTTTESTTTTEKMEDSTKKEEEVTSPMQVYYFDEPKSFPEIGRENYEAENRNCGCTTLVGLTTESGYLVEMMLFGSLVLNIYLAFCPPMFCLLLENGWLKAFRSLLEGKTMEGRKIEQKVESKEGKCEVADKNDARLEELPLPELV